MTNLSSDDELIAEILQVSQTIAVIGASDNEMRPSFGVMAYLKEQGYQTLPVNPRLVGKLILGELCYASLEDITHPIDIVNIFRPTQECLRTAEQAISIGAKHIWMQIGIVNEEAKQTAERAGLNVVMNKCTKVEHKRLSLLGMKLGH